MKIKNAVFWVFFFLLKSVLAQDVFKETISDTSIKTVIIYAYDPNANFQNRILNSPVTQLNSGIPIILEFDDLKTDYTQYRVRLIHCDVDWQKSNLLDLEYIDGVNEFIINEYSVAESAKVPYYHYSFRVPRVKMSGNYILQVFEDRLDGKLVIQKKFQIYEPKIGISANIISPVDPSIWKTRQQVNLALSLNDYFISFPKRELRVFIRQNQRDDRMIEFDNNMMSSTGNGLVFNYFKNENTFSGGNEYRFIDASISFSGGVNMGKTILGDTNTIMTQVQNSRAKLGYVSSYDRDGDFIINSASGSNPDLTADYVKVKFLLKSEALKPNEIPIVYGRFNNWDPNQGKMSLNFDTGLYENTVVLKNGIYDFCFSKYNEDTQRTDDVFYENEFSDTENNYEVFVYQKSPSFRAYQLIGYQMVNFNLANK